MARKKTNNTAEHQRRHKVLKTGFWAQLAKEASTIPAYAARELTGQPHDRKPKCKLKSGWFE